MIFFNLIQNSESNYIKSSRILGNPGKSLEILGNPRNPKKSLEILGNPWKSLEILGNPRKYRKRPKRHRRSKMMYFNISLYIWSWFKHLNMISLYSQNLTCSTGASATDPSSHPDFSVRALRPSGAA